MNLPPELRNMVYRMLLTHQYAYQSDPFHTAILRCNRRVHKEAMQILLGENIWVIVKVDGRLGPLILDAKRPVFRKGADAIQYPALRIDLTMPLAGNAPPQEYITLLMGDFSIVYFVRVLWRISSKEDTEQDFRATSLSLTLCETPFHAKSKLQWRCLVPFGFVHGLRSLSIRGQVDPACRKKIMDSAESGMEDMSELQYISNLCIELGYKAFLAGDSMKALTEYVYGSDYLNHVLTSRLSRSASVSAIREEIEILTIWNLRIDAHIIRAYLKIGEYEGVKSTGRSILMIPPLPADLGVLVRLCVARAHRALGEREQESRLFDEALDAMSDKSTFMEALVTLFLDAPLHFAEILAGEKVKARRGEAINLDAIMMVWKTL